MTDRPARKIKFGTSKANTHVFSDGRELAVSDMTVSCETNNYSIAAIEGSLGPEDECVVDGVFSFTHEKSHLQGEHHVYVEFGETFNETEVRIDGEEYFITRVEVAFMADHPRSTSIVLSGLEDDAQSKWIALGTMIREGGR